MEASTTEVLTELQRLGLKQTEIARRTGIPQPRLSRWQAGGAGRAADDALKLKALLDAERVARVADGKAATG